MNTINQCRGCQAGWPTEEHSPWPPNWQVDKTKTITFHTVVGGYKGERCVCTKRLYEVTTTDEHDILPTTTDKS